MQSNSSCQVVIVGAGPTGLTVANLLGRLSVSTIVIERGSGISELPKTLFVDDEFFQTVNGLGAALAGHALAPVDFEYRSPTGVVLARVDGRVTLNNFHNRNAIFQPEFEQILLDGVDSHSKVTLLFSHEFNGFEVSGEGVVVHLRGPDGAPRSISISRTSSNSCSAIS